MTTLGSAVWRAAMPAFCPQFPPFVQLFDGSRLEEVEGSEYVRTLPGTVAKW